LISERARPLVRAALAARRAELGARGAAVLGTSDDPEEALRKIMVRSLPKLAEIAKDSARLAETLALVLSLGEKGRGEDVRFLDAWNAIYEALPASAREATFLDAYAQVLDLTIARLSP